MMSLSRSFIAGNSVAGVEGDAGSQVVVHNSTIGLVWQQPFFRRRNDRHSAATARGVLCPTLASGVRIGMLRANSE
jgi:hypothetical protein